MLILLYYITAVEEEVNTHMAKPSFANLFNILQLVTWEVLMRLSWNEKKNGVNFASAFSILISLNQSKILDKLHTFC